MTKAEIREIIDKENGAGFSLNINLNGYVFTKNNSFLIFELKNFDDIKVCHIKYIHFEKEKDLITILVNCCNFWMGNDVHFIFYKEKERKNSPINFLKNLNFRVESDSHHNWKYNFECIKCKNEECKCIVYNLYK